MNKKKPANRQTEVKEPYPATSVGVGNLYAHTNGTYVVHY